MLKTYLYIPDELNRKIEQTSKLNGKSKAEVIRNAIENGLEKNYRNKELRRQEYIKKLLTIKGDWFDFNEYKRNRRQVERQISKRVL